MKLFGQRAAAIVATTLVAGFLAFGGATATAEVTVTPVEGPPTATGVVTPFIDFVELGFDLSEVFIEGEADSYHNVGELTNEAPWGVEPDGDPQYFKTRIQVVKPVDGDFNGTVYVEWLNVTALRDAAPDLFQTYAEIKRRGAVYVGVSAQWAGISQLQECPAEPPLPSVPFPCTAPGDPARYGSLVHPGDSYSYDIFSQVGQALRDQADVIFGPGIEPERLIATGHSQSGSRTTTYVNAFGDSGPYDAYMPRATSANPSAALRQATLGPPQNIPSGLEDVIPPSPTWITNSDKPVIRWQSESEDQAARQPDSKNFRWWEVAGSSHQDLYPLAGDDGESLEGVEQLFNWMIDPLNMIPSVPIPCAFGLNAGPGAWVQQAALRRLDSWVRFGKPAPTAPRFETFGGEPADPSVEPPDPRAIVRDEHGNAVGGVRSPHLDVPIATLRGRVQDPGPGFCGVFGATIPFSEEKLDDLYRRHSVFTIKWLFALVNGTAHGYFLPEDAWRLWLVAAESDIGR